MYMSFILSAVSSTKTLYNGKNQQQVIHLSACVKKTEPSFGPSFRIIDLSRLIAARCQILAVRRKRTQQTTLKTELVSLARGFLL